MTEVWEVPGFIHILIHTGNTEDHTAGCLLVGDKVRTNEDKQIPHEIGLVPCNLRGVQSASKEDL